MECPRDHTPLRQSTRRDVTVDFCDACKGTWFDKGEFEQKVFNATGAVGSLEQIRARLNKLELSYHLWWHGTIDEADINCPICGPPMKKIVFGSGDLEVVGDRCAICEGFWFDSGEKGSVFVLLQRRSASRRMVATIAVLVLLAALLALAALLS